LRIGEAYEIKVNQFRSAKHDRQAGLTRDPPEDLVA